MKSLPRAARGRGTAKRWKGRFERSYEQGLLYGVKMTSYNRLFVFLKYSISCRAPYMPPHPRP